MKVVVRVRYREQGSTLQTENILNPSQGDWPVELWDQLASKTALAYGDSLVSVVIFDADKEVGKRQFKSYGPSAIARYDELARQRR